MKNSLSYSKHQYSSAFTCGSSSSLDLGIRASAERLSAGTAGAAVSVETGWRVKVTEIMADRAAPAVVQPRLVRPWLVGGRAHREKPRTRPPDR
jgi:hypothetical protein